jgi:hypothetical protein
MKLCGAYSSDDFKSSDEFQHFKTPISADANCMWLFCHGIYAVVKNRNDELALAIKISQLMAKAQLLEEI